uniref:Predicted protein n=1 Tax=Hordeum vulgare subsp. vulgare TaxID=112509 RepID=F2DQU0_HORVV|nr:predicted protein [Hordeum vulgare subsp. vulgare]
MASVSSPVSARPPFTDRVNRPGLTDLKSSMRALCDSSISCKATRNARVTRRRMQRPRQSGGLSPSQNTRREALRGHGTRVRVRIDGIYLGPPGLEEAVHGVVRGRRAVPPHGVLLALAGQVRPVLVAAGGILCLCRHQIRDQTRTLGARDAQRMATTVVSAVGCSLTVVCASL